MADSSAVTTGTSAEPAVVNGFDRLAAATAAPASPGQAPGHPPTTAAGQAANPAETSPTKEQPATAPAAESAESEEVAPYSHQPHLLPEHALLGSLLYAPKALDELESFLGARDFTTPQTRAVYATLRGLHQAGALFDVATMPTEAQRLQAANENQLRLFTALRARPPRYTNITIDNVPRLLTQLNTAAPPESLPFRGIYDPGAQLRLARTVLEASCRRQLHALGVLMRRFTPLTAPAHRSEQAAQSLTTNLTTVQHQLHAITDRLLRAVDRTAHATAPDTSSADAGKNRTAGTTSRRWTLPDPVRALSAPLRHRAENHLLHLAMHAGRLSDIPAEILNLAPEDFTTERHANLWRTIKDLHSRGLPANYVAVFLETRADGFAHHPMPSDRALLRMALPPDIRPDRVARSLHTITATALARAAQRTGRTVTALAANTTTPIQTALAHAADQVDALAARATTAQPQRGRHSQP
jgi:predicted lipoprotein